MSNPIDFQTQMYLNEYQIKPAAVKGQRNLDINVYKRYLWYQIYSVFKFKLPKDWELNWFRFFLFRTGSIGVIYVDGKWVCNPYSITKYGLYYKPTNIECVSQFWTGTRKGIIGLNAGIIRLLDDWWTLEDLVNKYAYMLSQCDHSVDVNLLNQNPSLIAYAKSKKEADEIKEAYSRATQGEPIVLMNKDIQLNGDIGTEFDTPLKTNEILLSWQTITHRFLTAIGIKNSNYDKKERLTTDEVAENNDETSANVHIMRDNLDATIEEVNNVTQLGLGYELRYDYENKESEVNNGKNNDRRLV